MKTTNQWRQIALCSAVLLGIGAQAEQFSFVGARATGMAGANAASVMDATAQFHNPAAFGFMGKETSTNAVDLDNNKLSKQDWGWNLIGIGAGYNMTEDMGRYLNIISDVDFDNVDELTTGTAAENQKRVRDLIAIASALKGVSQPGNSFYVDANVGSSIRIGSFGVGFHFFGEAAAWIDELDTANLGLTISGLDIDADIASVIAGDTSYPGGYTPQNFSPSQQATLSGAGLNPASINYLDYQLGLLIDAGTINSSDIENATSLLADIVNNAGGGDLDDNRTAVAARGFGVTAIPISYGRAINDNLSLGVTLKALFGRVYGTRVWVFDEDNLEEAVESVSDTESETLTFGLDLGALYRINNFQFAVVGHNLNKPTLDGYTDTITYEREGGGTVTYNVVVPDVELDPQITLGAAFIPSRRLTVEMNYDLLETGTLLNGYDIQRISFGGEFDLWAVAFRAGLYQNLAESAEDPVLTAGLGLNAWLARVDVGGAISLGDNAEIDGNEIPTQARLYAGVTIDF